MRQARVVHQARDEIHAILTGASDKLVVLAGPSAIDQPSAALEYGARLAGLAREVAAEIVVVMRSEVCATRRSEALIAATRRGCPTQIAMRCMRAYRPLRRGNVCDDVGGADGGPRGVGGPAL